MLFNTVILPKTVRLIGQKSGVDSFSVTAAWAVVRLQFISQVYTNLCAFSKMLLCI